MIKCSCEQFSGTNPTSLCSCCPEEAEYVLQDFACGALTAVTFSHSHTKHGIQNQKRKTKGKANINYSLVSIFALAYQSLCMFKCGKLVV